MTPRLITPSQSISGLAGYQDLLKVTQPSAGADWTITLPGGYYYRILGGSATFVSSSGAANRVPRVEYLDPVNVAVRSAPLGVITASLTVAIGFLGGQGAGVFQVTGPSGAVGVPSIWLRPGWIVQSVTQNIQAGDQWSSVVLFVERMYDPDDHTLSKALLES